MERINYANEHWMLLVCSVSEDDKFKINEKLDGIRQVYAIAY